MVVYVLLKGYDYEGFGSNVEVFDSREKAEARKEQYKAGTIKGAFGDAEFAYDYDSLKVVKRVVG